jgi:hypothetical protein
VAIKEIVGGKWDKGFFEINEPSRGKLSKKKFD